MPREALRHLQKIKDQFILLLAIDGSKLEARCERCQDLEFFLLFYERN